jgi:hypothetical protein
MSHPTPDEIFDAAAGIASRIVEQQHHLHDATYPNCQHCRLMREQQGLHIHTSSTGAGFDPTCENCRDIEAGRRNWSNMGITRQAPDQGKRPESWMVQDPYGRIDHVFERPDLAMAYAGSVSRSDRPTIVTDPEGVQVLVLRVDPRVTVQAVRNLTGPAPECSGPDCPTCRSLAEQPRPEASVQALAGARLFFALYHHPKIYPELLGKDGPLSNTGFMKAYTSAQRAFLPDEAQASRQSKVYRDDDEMLIEQGRREGRHQAAEAIRQQARMFGTGGEFSMVSHEVAAQLAEGTTGVKAGEQ